MNNMLEVISNKSTDQYKIIEAKLNYLIDYMYFLIKKQDGVIEEDEFNLICYTLNINPVDKEREEVIEDE